MHRFDFRFHLRDDNTLRLGKILHGFLYQSEEIILQRFITLQIGFHLFHRLRTQHQIDGFIVIYQFFQRSYIIGGCLYQLPDTGRIIHRFMLQRREAIV